MFLCFKTQNYKKFIKFYNCVCLTDFDCVIVTFILSANGGVGYVGSQTYLRRRK